ncbi:MAG: phosphoribosylamine--glycine ligase, partial [candidate division WOR-3 bacterium]
MRILVLGSGGREHALVWKFALDGHDVTCCPGNPGIAQIAKTEQVDLGNLSAVADFAERGRFDLAVVGPEALLVAGIADVFAERGLVMLGPGARGAQLEGSKAFAKQLMSECGIPTAAYAVFSDFSSAVDFVSSHALPLVIKASGLAAGKGAVAVHSQDQARETLRKFMIEQTLGPAGRTVVVEEYLAGEEASITAITDGEAFLCLAPAQDHKPLLDDDKGPNTGGMGAYAPAPVVSPAVQAKVEGRILRPLLSGLRRMGITYRGVIYAGIMVRDEEVWVVEFNCRFGDPEAQVILPVFKGDLARLLLAAAMGRLGSELAQSPVSPGKPVGHALCVVAASQGYPGKYRTGLPIAGLELA